MPINKLYHGTLEIIAKQTPKIGLKPYSESMFSDVNKNTITLTSVYGGVQSFYANQLSDRDRWAIVEINVNRLDENNLSPCTEWLEGKLKGKNKTWQKSLETVGLVLHNGIIPAKAIAKVWTYNPLSNWMLTRTILHSEIGVNRFTTDQKKLSAVNKWLTGEFVTVDEWLSDQKDQFTREQKSDISALWHERSGLDLYYKE